MTINDNERKVLEQLAEDDEVSFYFKSLVGDGLDIKAVRRACRSLARKGLAEFHRGLFNDDGMVAGSGYGITAAGSAFISPCDLCSSRAVYDYDGKRECEEHYGKSVRSIAQPLLQ